MADVNLVHQMSVAQAHDSADEFNVLATPESVGEHLLKNLDKYTCRILEHQGEPVGMLICYENYWVYEGTRVLVLESLYIHKDWRRHGFATEAFDWLHKVAAERGLPEISWMAAITNDPAHGFYMRIGASRSEKWRVYAIPTRTDAA